jgi:phosphatidylserine synthase
VVIGAILGIKAVMLMQIPIKSLWEISWLKTIILSLQFIAILRIIILFGIMAPTTNLVNGNTK